MTPTSEGCPINLCDLPFVIETEAQYNEAIAITERLFFKQNKTEKEEQLLEVWSVLVEIYEKNTFQPGAASTPISVLTSLMEARGLTQAELAKAGIASSGVVSEIINGKRAIAKQQAEKLAELFHVSPSLFIWPSR